MGETQAGEGRAKGSKEKELMQWAGSRVHGPEDGPEEEGNCRRSRIHRKGKDVQKPGNERLGKEGEVEGKGVVIRKSGAQAKS